MPTDRLTAVALRPMASESRVPISRRLRTSRPYSSVPSQYVALGGRKRVRIEIVSQGCGAIQGASRPRTTITPVIASPAFSCGDSALRSAGRAAASGGMAKPDLRVQVHVEKIGDQIRERLDCGDDEDRGLQRRNVAVLDREDDKTP